MGRADVTALGGPTPHNFSYTSRITSAFRDPGGSTMFDRLFQHPHARARHRDGPLSKERCRYVAHGPAQQMARLTLRHIANDTLVVAKVLRLADRPGELIPAEEIEAGAKRWARHRSKPPKKRALECARRGFRRHALR